MRINKIFRITVYGVTFNGVEEVVSYVQSGKPKEGVYVKADSKGYPCFDSGDFNYETRRYWNFIFGRSKEEVEQNLQLIRDTAGSFNYCKLRKDVPMMYWGGDCADKEVVSGGSKDVVISEAELPSPSKPKQPGRVPAGESRMERIMEKLKADMHK